jgi:hypothetical protein
MRTDEGSRAIIRAVQNYCFINDAENLVIDFTTSIESTLVSLISRKELTATTVENAVQKHHDFITANGLDVKTFAGGLFQSLRKIIPYFSQDPFDEIMLRIRRRFETDLSRVFVEGTSEDKLRTIWKALLDEESFIESKTSSGQCDICVPSQRLVIETKLWKGEQYYEDGLPELIAYLNGFDYENGYYIVFDYLIGETSVSAAKGRTFDIQLDGKRIHVMFVKMKHVAPSQIGKHKRKAMKR